MSTTSEDRPYAPPASGAAAEAQPRGLPRTSIVLMIFLSLVTLGLYVPYWFASRRKAFDELAPEGESVNGLTYTVVALYAGAFGFGLFVGFVRGESLSTGSNLDGWLRILDLSSRILTIILSFRIKSILESNYPGHLSAVGTFFLSLLYLQYKINRLDEMDPAAEFSLR